MDRCALFVDAGYVLADGAQAVHGTRHRDSVSWDYPGLVRLLAAMAQEHAGLPVLRCYWYDAAADGRRAAGQDELADLPGVTLRLDSQPPGRAGGETGIRRDLSTLARNRAVSDVVIVTADECLSDAIGEAQDSGIRVAAMHITAASSEPIPRVLRQECDEVIEVTAEQLRPFAELVAEPAPSADEPAENDDYQGGELASGHGGRLAALPPRGGTTSAVTSGSPAYAGPPAEYRRAEPMLTGVAPGAGHGRPRDGGSSDAAAGQDGHENPAAGLPPGQGSYAANGYPANGYAANGRAQDSESGPWPGRPAGSSAPPEPDRGGLPPHPQAGYQQNGLTRPDDGLPRRPPPDSSLPYPAAALRPSQVPPGGSRAQPGSSIAAQASGPYDSPPAPPPRFSTPLAESVQAAHAEGFGFGEAVARDAPALWLEAVLARKPRMPSDLEARLLQGSALPVDSLLQDEVRHALRRGFWDALERSRR